MMEIKKVERPNSQLVIKNVSGQSGTATLIAVLILALLSVFVAASLSRVTTEAVVMGNDSSNTRAFYAAQASLELMSRNFNRVFDSQLRPSLADLTRIRNTKPNIDSFQFIQDITPGGAGDTRVIEDGDFAGLISLRTPYRLDATATYPNGAQVQLTRTFYNHQIPIFQFGIFYNDDMEFHPGPQFNFGGRVHSNGNIFMMSGNNLVFRSRVTAVGEIVRDVSRNGIRPGDPGWAWNGTVSVADATGTFQPVIRGSVIATGGVSGTNPDMPAWTDNNNWETGSPADSAPFTGNLLADRRALRLPLQISGNSDPIELVKRGRDANDYEVTALGRPVDDEILRGSRYCNKPGIRVSLSDGQAELPGGGGGVRLDGASDGLGGDQDADGSRGYWPLAMAGGYPRAKRVNGHRLYTGPSYAGTNMTAFRQTWIKVELVTLDPDTLAIQTRDITVDFLSLGVTHMGGLNIGDDRAILKIQRYEIPGPPIKVDARELVNGNNVAAVSTQLSDGRMRAAGTLPNVYSYYVPATGPSFSYVATSNSDGTALNSAVALAETSHEVSVVIGLLTYRVVPFPIKIFNTREGLYNEDLAALGAGASWASLYTGGGAAWGPNSKVPYAGVVSLIDIDMGNLGRFVRNDFDGQFPNGLVSTDLPDNGGSGTIVYVSDRRGDRDDDGEYDMEDIYGPNNGTLQAGEDVNRNGVLDVDFDSGANNNCGEAARYDVSIETDLAATRDFKYFRRGVRLINGETLIGTINKGYSVASENGIYVLGNYNATGVTAVGTPTQPNQYTGAQVPASIVSDAVTILSRNWQDGKSFRNPFRYGTRTGISSAVRAALLMGDTLSSFRLAGAPSSGGGDAFLAGGVHNFPRFLENWGSTLSYCGSLINLFNSHQYNGGHKSGSNTYSPPTRNWVFDASFLDPNRLPPGTPFFQFVQMTGFRQTVRQIT